MASTWQALDKCWFWSLPKNLSHVLVAILIPLNRFLCVCVRVCTCVHVRARVCACVCVCVSCSVMSDSLQPHGLWPTRLLCPWNSQGKNPKMGFHSLLQGLFSTQGSNLGLLHCRQILYHLSHQGSPTFINFLHLSLRLAFLPTPKILCHSQIQALKFIYKEAG